MGACRCSLPITAYAPRDDGVVADIDRKYWCHFPSRQFPYRAHQLARDSPFADIYVTAGVLEPESISQQSWVQSAHQRIEIDTTFLGRKMTIVGVDVDAPDFTASSVIGADPDAFNRWMSGGEIGQSSASDTLSIDVLAHNYSVADGPIIDSVASGGSAAGFVGSTATSADTIKAFANEQLRYLAGVEVGDAFDLPTVLGTRRFEVLGFFHDYGNVNYALHLPAQTFLELFP